MNLDVVKLPFGPAAWVDADRRIFEACFVVLGQFVEGELGQEDGEHAYRGFRLHSADIEEGDVSGVPVQKSTDRAAIDLWLWYRDELPALRADYARDVHECYSGERQIAPPADGVMRVVTSGRIHSPKYPYEYPETVCDEKLAELMAIRRGLWT